MSPFPPNPWRHRMRLAAAAATTAVAAMLLLAALVLYANVRGEAPLPDAPTPFSPTPQQIERGAYLARAGNCAGCHTTRGGAAYAGGHGIATPFGTVYAGNLTPDVQTGIGSWTPDHFWRALHNGRAKDGRLLYPAFPYPSYTQVTREDADAIYAWLRTLPAASQPRQPHTLRFPYNTQAALAVWRALFFEPTDFQPEPGRSADWNRGAYLVRGLGHCAACHAERNPLGATRDAASLAGGFMPLQGWYAPSLASPGEAGMAGWDTARVTALLQHGATADSAVLGPMASVVFDSTQHLTARDLRAMAVFLTHLPQHPSEPDPAPAAEAPSLARGAKVYEQHCAACHGPQGQGAGGAYPPLAGNRAATMATPANLIRVVLDGGFAPATAANPRPYGMPPFNATLTDQEVADVLTYVRQSWGHRAAPVTELEVLRAR